MDSYKEYMVQKKKTMKDYLIRGVCVWIFLVLCMLSLFFVRDMFLRTIIFALTMALILACIYIIFPKTDIEYEYLYCDKTITVDAIYAKSKRKKMGEFELDRIDIICPVGSYRLDQFNTGKMEVVDYKNTGVFLIYLWCSAGDSGPYQAPKTVYVEKGEKVDRNLKYWIRPASITTEAKQDEISELFDKFNSVPFDDRVNRSATIENIRRGYLEDFIVKSNSSLIQDLNSSSLEELLLAEEVANETDTELDIRNIGVLMFSEKPDKFIPGACIELIKFNSVDAEASDDFIEKSFNGPIWKQVQDALDYIKTNVIEEKVVKISGKAEADRYFNYPYNALEEALVNAIFHKSYREPEPVEIRIYVDSIQIINYPGLAKWINLERFTKGKIKGRKYRNRRIGELFKEIDLSEKKRYWYS